MICRGSAQPLGEMLAPSGELTGLYRCILCQLRMSNEFLPFAKGVEVKTGGPGLLHGPGNEVAGIDDRPPGVYIEHEQCFAWPASPTDHKHRRRCSCGELEIVEGELHSLEGCRPLESRGQLMATLAIAAAQRVKAGG